MASAVLVTLDKAPTPFADRLRCKAFAGNCSGPRRSPARSALARQGLRRPASLRTALENSTNLCRQFDPNYWTNPFAPPPLQCKFVVELLNEFLVQETSRSF
jgi:hypothetical protein